MLHHLGWRILQSVVVVWVVYTVTFALLMLAPGDPFLGDEKKPPPAVVKALSEKYGLGYLSLPPKEREKLSSAEKFNHITHAYFLYLGKALCGDFGPTIKYPNFSVLDVIRNSLPVSATLGSLALIIALWGGVVAGTLGAVRKGRATDIVLSVVTLLGVSMPSFVVGALLMMLFVVYVPV